MRLALRPRFRPLSRQIVACSGKSVAPKSMKSPMTKSFRGVCTSITANRVSEAQELLKEAQVAKANLVELRLDFLSDFEPRNDLQRLLAACPVPSIVTCRPTWEGGNFSGEESTRLEILKQAIQLGAPYVDIELKAVEEFLREVQMDTSSTKLIVSYHDFEQTPSSEELAVLMDKLNAAGADITKIATHVNEISECKRLLKLLEKSTGPAIVLGMGGRGLMTRILAPKFGAFLTFGALKSGQESAPGQPTIDDLRNLYHIERINEETKVFGVIGNPVFHSKGPVFFNTRFSQLNYDGVYLPFLVDDFEKFIEAFRDDATFAGYSITVPHKESAVKLADSVEETTAKIGASNTYVRGEDGRFTASNTDWTGAIGVIEETFAVPLKNKTMVVIGAGGVSKALAFGGAERGAKIIVANRTQSKAEALAKTIPNCKTVPLSDLQNGQIQGDILANGTTIGMAPNTQHTPIPKQALKNFELVFDAVYTPKETQLLKDAVEMGCKVANGFDMFVRQAELQFERFTQMKPPPLEQL